MALNNLKPHHKLELKLKLELDLEIENLFLIETLGIKEIEIAKTDQMTNDELETEIEYKDKYFVKIPFKKSIKEVPSNWQIALFT